MKPIGEWPDNGAVDAAELIRHGWQPRPLSEFILKVQSRCNLNCDYCYVYHLADSSWRQQPNRMSERTVRAAAARIGEHSALHGLEQVSISMHGGEPLLCGRDYLERFISIVREQLGDVRVRFSLQTNGVLLDEETAAFLVREGVCVGVSLDGDEAANDLHRRFRNGRSSYRAASAGVRTMLRPEHRAAFGGVLCTIQLPSDPLRVWHSMLELGTPQVDFLLPHGTWTNPPPGLTPGDGATPYADWLLPIFDEWFDAPVKQAGVRIFEDVINLLLGGRISYESFGLRPVGLLVVETDGSYEQVDSLKAAYEGAAATGLNAFDHPLDDVLALPGVTARQIGADALSDTCRRCKFAEVCGGGLYSHRYRPGTGFLNPSVYCADLYALISHVERRVTAQLVQRGLDLDVVRTAFEPEKSNR
ncbi:FxsB family cyclophane-forming radical SAM/SPASM peptide maturase [Lentzea sp. NBRC 102530]|uniref:FxsB family cyclophane-forming radical SAM/SPASM peptide maturase n=1 Tax=Lentzea sp. NBRC 102530 TaxID=3032201 RepID=UPI0024A24772|nr:FxsB family cyclophane-forming radical SAM/SPASM peptide maturase [Lentzea sp. NBRC 102530]GLY50576.1 hypothetical protein Lesp01_42320 [Lentzea sp. NBRC 102530]